MAGAAGSLLCTSSASAVILMSDGDFELETGSPWVADTVDQRDTGDSAAIVDIDNQVLRFSSGAGYAVYQDLGLGGIALILRRRK